MSVVRPDSSVVKTDYDHCDLVLKKIHQVSFDLHDLVLLVDEQSNKGLAGSALSVVPPKLKLLCDSSSSSHQYHHHQQLHLQHQQKQTQQQQNQKSSGSSSQASGFGQDAQHNQPSATNKPASSSSFVQSLWDKGVHLFRLLRHLGKPLHGVPSIQYLPGELLSKIDQYNTELELLLLRSRSGKGSDDELCFQFVRGCCPRGASCSFAHSKLAVSSWAQRWAGEHLRDYTLYRILLKQHLMQANPSLFRDSAFAINENNQKKSSRTVSLTRKKLEHGQAQQEDDLAGCSPILKSRQPQQQQDHNVRQASKTRNPTFNSTKKERDSRSKNNDNDKFVVDDDDDDEKEKTQQFRQDGIFEVGGGDDEGDEGDLQFRVHPLCSGAALRLVDESIGPEALSVALDMIHQRDQVLELDFCRDQLDARSYPSSSPSSSPSSAAVLRRTKEGKLQSIIIRQPVMPRPVFDVLCSMIDLNLFSSLKAIDFSKCEVGNSCGRNRLGKLGRVLRRSAPCRDQNRMNLSLGSNSLSNVLAASLLAGFASAASHNNNQQQATAVAAAAAAGFCSQLNASGLSSVGTSNNNNAINTPQRSHHPLQQQQQQRNLPTMMTNAAPFNVNSNTSFGNVSFVSANSMAQQAVRDAAASTYQGSKNNSYNNHSAITSSARAAGDDANAASANDNNNHSNNNLIFDTEAIIPPKQTSHPLLALNLEFNNIGPSQPEFSEFIASLQECLPNIEKLSLAGNPLVYEGASRLFPSWRVNSTTAAAAAAISPTSAASGPSSAASPPRNAVNPSLAGNATNINFTMTNNNNNKFLNGSFFFCAIQYLDLSGCGLGDRGTNILCETIRMNGNNVKYLNLGWNGITADGGAVAVSDLLRQKNSMLKCLRLDYSPQIGRRGAVLLSQAIKENTVIRRLDLRWCYIGDEGALAILDSLGTSRNTSLAVLKCDAHDVDPRTRDALEERLSMVAATCREELMAMEVDIVW